MGALRSALSPVGVHIPETINYQSGMLQHWLDMLELPSGENLLAEFKLRDSAQVWRNHGNIPTPNATTQLFISEARNLGFRVMVQWSPWTLSNPYGADFSTGDMALLARAAKNLHEQYPDALLAGPGNEPRAGSWDGSDEDLYLAEAAVLREWNRLSHECAGYPEASIVAIAETARERFKVLRAHDAIPSWWQGHMYGQGTGADAPRHIADLRAAMTRATGVDIPFIYGEYHYGFPLNGLDYDDRPDLLTAETGGYVADLALHMQASGDAGVVFLLESMFHPNVDGTLNAAGTAFSTSWIAGALGGTPRSIADAPYRRKTYRLITQHRGPYMLLIGGPAEVLTLEYP